MKDTLLYELISNRNYLSSDDVYRNLSDKRFCARLYSIFEKEFVDKLISSRNNCIELKGITNVEFPQRYGEYTQIYVWGNAKSGKTSLLGALFSAIHNQCKKVKWMADSDTVDRISELIKFFSCENTSLNRLKNCYSPIQVYNVECVPKGGWQSTSYPLSFIEADMSDVRNKEFLTKQLHSANNKIHFFCFDCSVSLAEQQKQAHLFCQLLKQLKNSLKTTVGIYLIVTKTDTMLHVPEEYRHNAAQTLITAKHRQLWQQVVNLCYEMNIYDATPIPFSIGDVVLKDIVQQPNIKDAINLLHYPIFLKSYRYPSFLKKILWSGSKKRTIFILFLFLCSIIYALYTAFSIISVPPKIKPQSYNFEQDFIKRVKSELVGQNYAVSRSAYDNLRWELIVENRVVLSTGEKLKDVTNRCDSCLTNMFAGILINQYKSFFGQSNWYKKMSELQKLDVYVDILIDEPIITTTIIPISSDELTTFRQYFDDLYTLVFMMKLSMSCKDWYDVDYISSKYSSYKKYPYENDETLRVWLDNAVKKSHNSYSKWLNDMARTYRQDYNGQKKWGHKNNLSTDYFNRIINRYNKNTAWLRDKIDYAIEKSPKEFRDAYQAAQNKLDLNN